MNGGPFGRGKAPERACLKPEFWPDADRALWQAAITPGDVLDDCVAARASHSAASNRKAESGYGRWLTFLGSACPEALTLAPAERITAVRTRDYVRSLQDLGNASQTILARLQELGEVARVMNPAGNWAFLNRLGARVRASHKPARSKNHLQLSDKLLGLGLDLIEQAAATQGLAAARLHRDGLIIALLALVPIRRKNLAELQIGGSVINFAGCWRIILDESQTKTRQHHETDWPEALVEPLETYLARHRPLLTGRHGRWASATGDALWISSDGSPMTQIALYDVIRKQTKAAFGTAINPHLFRDAAATTLAIADPGHVRVAAPLLGHRSFATTERHYRQAHAMEAHRSFIDVIFPKTEDRS
jgi:integrase/recombinase XerD